ncbi:hypothetical protein ISP03_02240 [Staphylococcus kloosii]|jgi:phosphosulfolactate synthase (CoM biosynthesis protein A)|nr:hypothetical protein [Staphylococcus kloosii]
MLNDEEFEYIHINTGRQHLSEKELQEAKEYLKSKEFRDIIEKSKKSHERVQESKITNRTKY